MMFNRFKIFVFLLVAGFLFLTTAGPVLAVEQPPVQNPVCWTQEACHTAILSRGWKWNDNWEQGGPSKICQDLGVCRPASTSNLSIKIGDMVESKNLGDYIKTIFVYLVGIGGIVAAILIIKGGFEWMTAVSGADAVKNAQSTISSAVIGLFLLLGSYVLLFTINPDLVRLKLPGVYMLRTITIGTKWCNDLPVGTKLALAKDVPDSAATLQFVIDNNPSPVQWNVINPSQVPQCGKKYLWSSGADQTCAGHLCAHEANEVKTCVEQENKKSFYCQEGNIFGQAKYQNVAWGDDPVNDGGGVILCNDGYSIGNAGTIGNGYLQDFVKDMCKFKEISSTDQSTDYILSCNNSTLDKAIADCEESHGGFSGLFMALEFDDPDIFGGDDWYAVKCGEGSNLAKELFPSDTAPADMELVDAMNLLKDKKETAMSSIKGSLLSIAQLKQGMVCNVDLDKFNTD